MDFTLNSMTLLGLTLAVGIVIDDAIIVLENIYRYIDEKGVPPMQAAVQATREIALAVMATTHLTGHHLRSHRVHDGLCPAFREPVRLDDGDVHHGLHAGGLHADAVAQRAASEEKPQEAVRRNTSISTDSSTARTSRP